MKKKKTDEDGGHALPLWRPGGGGVVGPDAGCGEKERHPGRDEGGEGAAASGVCIFFGVMKKRTALSLFPLLSLSHHRPTQGENEFEQHTGRDK